MKNRIQKFPTPLHVGDQTSKLIKVFFCVNDAWKENHIKFNDLTKTKEENLKAAFEYVAECFNRGIPAFASAFIEEDQQAEIFTYAGVGCIEWLDRVTTDKVRGYRQSIERAKRLAFGGNIPVVSKYIKGPVRQVIVPANKPEPVIPTQVVSTPKEEKKPDKPMTVNIGLDMDDLLAE